jgi:shikimate kinase
MQNLLLSQQEFDTHIKCQTLRLSLVGMSNCGKSYRSRILECENNFFWYQVDEDIQKELDLSDQAAVSIWLGYPTSQTYLERENRYIELENLYTSRASMQSMGKNLVFDTTGSVIHLALSVLETLRENTLVVHLDVGDESLENLIEQFFQTPKPVAWSGYFNQHAGESEDSALRRSYPILLAERLRRYRELAHINIIASKMHDKSGDETLSIIRDKLKLNMI